MPVAGCSDAVDPEFAEICTLPVQNDALAAFFPPMPSLLPLACAALVAYLIGSLSFAVIVSRSMGLDDPRDYGSGNPGATNVLRSGNKSAAGLTLLLDLIKGMVPVMLAQRFGAPWALDLDAALAVIGLAALLGHLWPVFFHFHGGKGVATAAGLMLAFSPWLGLTVLATWLVVARLTRYSSLAAIVAATLAPAYHLFFLGRGPMAIATGVMAVLLVWRHRGNIAKLLAGAETRLGSKAVSVVQPASPDKKRH